MLIKTILLFSLLSLCNIGFPQHLRDSIIKTYQHSLPAEGHNKYVLIELDVSAPQALVNKILSATTRQLTHDLYIIDRSLFYSDLSANPYIKNILPVNDNWKLSPAMDAVKTSAPYREQQLHTFNVLIKHPDFALKFLRKFPAFTPSAKLLSAQKILSLNMTNGQVEDLLLHEDSVVFIDVLTEKPLVELGTPGYDLSVNKINVVHDKYPDINGAGQQVSIKEDYYDTTDIDIKGRFKYSPLASTKVSNHANFMATIIAGAGNSANYAKGAAWGAQISSSSFESILPDQDSYYQQQQITVQNHSYGTVIENRYGLNAVAFDLSAGYNPGLLHVFSSGNTGTGVSSTGKYAGISGYANLTGNFKMAKNILTVGAVDSLTRVVPLSSRGPAYDGRIKPELVAFQKNGTSEAAALVSGTALLLQQFYSMQHPGSNLPSALAKAILINTAEDIGAPGPDFNAGFGNMNAIKAMDILKENKLFSGNIAQGTTQSFLINVPANVSTLKITLVWNDTAASPLAPNALVNDVDLEVTLPANGFSWKPWVLNSFASVDSLNKVAVRKKDSINNVEQVTIQSPVQGSYSVNIKGYNLPAGTQTYYVAYGWDSLKFFNWDGPGKSALMEAGNRSILRWQNSFTGNGSIEYAIVPSNNWQTVAPIVDLSKNYFYWDVPDTISQAVVRIKVGNLYFYTDTFIISTLLKPTTGAICGDSVLIYWNKLRSINRYQLYQLGDQYMEPLFIVNDTVATIRKTVLKDNYIAVAPVLTNGLTAQKSYAFNYTTQGAACYINSFYVNRNADVARLSLSLGTLVNVAAISFEKQAANGYVPVQSAPLTSQLQYLYDYAPLKPGISYFRVKITLASGQVIYSNPEAVFYTAPGKYVLMPVPASRGNDITIIADLPEGEVISVIDVMGRIVLQQPIQSTRILLKTAHLPAGQYFYRIHKKGIQVASGKFIIL
ncbi:MAG: S8 family serine peptidase [Ferruginibacter sp.]